MTSSVAGLMTSSVRPESDAHHSPSMNILPNVAFAVAVVMVVNPCEQVICAMLRHLPSSDKELKRNEPRPPSQPGFAFALGLREPSCRSARRRDPTHRIPYAMLRRFPANA